MPMTTNEEAISHLEKMLRNAKKIRRESRQYIADLKYFNHLQRERGQEPIMADSIGKQEKTVDDMDRLIPLLYEKLALHERAGT